MFPVIGETARSQNFSMNGYSRDTNAFTSKSGGVISFKICIPAVPLPQYPFRACSRI